MSKITAEMWEKAISDLREIRFDLETKCCNLGMTALWSDEMRVGQMWNLQYRYDDGERSVELYNAIMELC